MPETASQPSLFWQRLCCLGGKQALGRISCVSEEGSSRDHLGYRSHQAQAGAAAARGKKGRQDLNTETNRGRQRPRKRASSGGNVGEGKRHRSWGEGDRQAVQEGPHGQGGREGGDKELEKEDKGTVGVSPPHPAS